MADRGESASVAHQEFSDANFFALVHNVLEANRLAGIVDPRDNRRRQFACLQCVAPYRDGRLPAQAEFARVLCRDLSPTGFSYLASAAPDCEYLVVALGPSPSIMLSAQVVHNWPVETDAGTKMVVGCRFIARIKFPDLALSSGLAR
jgi:hypothetical protein